MSSWGVRCSRAYAYSKINQTGTGKNHEWTPINTNKEFLFGKVNPKVQPPGMCIALNGYFLFKFV
jgi:hypothetical protein